MVWPPSVKGILVTESVRGDGGILTQLRGQAVHVRLHPGRLQGSSTPTTEEEGDRWYTDPDNNRRPPELLPARRGRPRHQLRGQGRPRLPARRRLPRRRRSRLPAEVIRKQLPSMYHQFKELADVDITKEPMEVGPTCHYVMGGVEVDPDTAAAPASPACSRPARSPAACTAPTGSAATRCPTCWSSAGAPGWAPPSTSTALGERAPGGRPTQIDATPRPRRWRRSQRRGRREPVHDPRRAPADDERPGRHHPHGVGDARRRSSGSTSSRSGSRSVGVEGAPRSSTRAGTSRSTCATCCSSRECVARAALERAGEPRRPHPRRLPGDERRVAASSTSSARADGRRRRRSSAQPLAADARRTCSSCSTSTS